MNIGRSVSERNLANSQGRINCTTHKLSLLQVYLSLSFLWQVLEDLMVGFAFFYLLVLSTLAGLIWGSPGSNSKLFFSNAYLLF